MAPAFPPQPAATTHQDAAAAPAVPRAAERWARWAGFALLVAAFLLYVATLDRGLAPAELVGGDLITHQYAQVQARPSNAPGYPLYTMGGWLWFHAARALPLFFRPTPPNPLLILSFYSTIWALLALWLLYELVRLITSSRYRPESSWGRAGNWPLALLLSAFYAVTYFFWYYATTTEQYSSAVAQTLAILLVFLHWQRADAAAGPAGYGLRSRAGLLLVALAFLNGLSLAHMLTVAFITPPLIVAVLWQRPGLLRRPALLAAVLAGALLPVAGYAYVWLRGSAHPEWWGAGEWESAGAWFRAFLSTAQGRDELSWGLEPGRAFFGGGFPALMASELSLPLLLLGLLGIAWLKRDTARVLYATLVFYAIFCWLYRFGNWYQVVLPVYPLLLLGVAALAHWLLERTGRAWLRASLYAVLALAILWRVGASWPEANSRSRPEDTALHRAFVLLETAPANAALFAAVEDALALDYLLSIWGLRPEVTIVTAVNAGDALEAGRPLLSTWDAAPTLLADAPAWLPAEIREAAPEMPLRLATYSPDWVQVLPAGGLPSPAPIAALHPRISENRTLLNGAITLESWDAGHLSRALLPGYREPAPSLPGAPSEAADPRLGAYIRLAWALPAGWPEGVSLSIRPLRDGEPVRDATGAPVQADIAAPMHGLLAYAADPNHPVDAIRLPRGDDADGFLLLLYRATESGFETLDEVILEFPRDE